MIEWAAIAAAVAPYLKDYAKGRAKKLAGEQADNALSNLYAKLVPNKTLTQVNQAFATRFAKELDSSIDLPTLQSEPYKDALVQFLKNPSVQDLIQAPLDGDTAPDAQLLGAVWEELRLIPLPEEFNWPKLARLHKKGIEALKIADPELRPVVVALAALRTAKAAEKSATTLERIAGPARDFDLKRYARALQQAYAHLKLGSLDSDWTRYDRGVRLESVYVPQSVKQALPPRDLTRDYLRTLKQEQREHGLDGDEEQTERRRQEYAELSARPLMEVVDDPSNQRLVILGDPGLGKSTLLRRLALRWAEQPEGPLPLLVELRRASPGSEYKSFLDYLASGADQTLFLPRAELHEHLKSREALVLFDGLDEVTASSRDAAVAAVITFAEDYPRARVVVTTRIHGYHPGSKHPGQFRDARFEQFTLQDFEASEIDSFVELWHQEAFQDATERATYEQRLRKAIADSPAIAELAANPLLLTMMAILSRSQDLPRDRGKLYERCAELLLKNWDLEKFPALRETKEDLLDIKDKLGPDQKMRILERVADAMQQERSGLAGNLIAEDKLKQIVRAELTGLGVPQSWSVAGHLIKILQDRNFMLGYMGDGQYAFIHRTFLEYFCARDLKRRLEQTSGFGVEDLQALFRDHWREDAWHEALRLVCGLIGAEYAARSVSELLAQEQQNDGHRAVFLAAQCLQEIRQIGLTREPRVQTHRRLLVLTRFDLPYFYEEWAEEAREVAKIRGRAVQELARGWKEDPGTLEWLRERASGDDNWAVRQAAVEELARGWKEDPGTLELLRERASGDDHGAVRQAAVQELARGWKDDPEVQQWLDDLNKTS